MVLPSLKPGIPRPAPPMVAVIGGGYAGMAAAVTLAERGIACRVFEAGMVLGGRARRVIYRDLDLDNGQHILLGAYRELLQLMHKIGAPEDALARYPLTLHLHPAFALQAPRLPAPLHLAFALLTARGLSWKDRASAIAFAHALKRLGFMIAAGTTVAQLLETHRQTETVTRCLWEPLCIAALNTPIDRAAAQVFVNVVRDALFRRRADSDLLLPRVDLSALFPEPAARWLMARGSQVDMGRRVTSVAPSATRFALADQHGATREFDAVICAVAPHQLAAISLPFAMPAQIEKYEPIYTVYLCYPTRVALPFPILGRTAGCSQWMLDREALCATPGLISAVISASGAHENMDHDLIAQAVHAELEEMIGTLPAPLWHKVIAEKFATFACEPDMLRPNAQLPLGGIFLAGDYVKGDYPATLEGAVRSGIGAAQLAHEFLSMAKH
jgi:squalene-associated FAD-dependent desaturase